MKEGIYNTGDQYPALYAYKLLGVPSHERAVKIGETTIRARNPEEITSKELEEAAWHRIKQQVNTALVPVEVVFTGVAVGKEDNGEFITFSDHDVRRVLRRFGKKKFSSPDKRLTGKE